MRAPWIVHEGYLLCKPQDVSIATATASAVSAPAATSPTHANGSATPQLLQHPFKNGLNHFHAPHLNGVMAVASGKKLVERYVVIYMNRKMEMYEAAPSIKAGADGEAAGEKEHGGERGKQIGVPLYVSAFAGWDGDGLLKVGESYGLELKVDPKAHGSGRNTTSMHVAAFNRVDLEKWCRAIVAVLDPQSAAGEEVRREHRRVRKEEKRLEQERQDKIRKWREMKIKQAEEERERMLAREEEISNMTPLERVDGLGSLDDDTAEFLEKRKLRLQKRHAPTTGRVNKAAYRKRIEEAAGGKLENMQPLQPKIVETKIRVRVELPLPGQFIEAAGISSTHRIGLPNSKDRTRLGSSSSESSLENPSDTSSVSSNSLLSSGHSGSSSSQMKHASRTGFAPPPPPPPHALMMMQQNRDSSLRSSFVPPPPPPQSGSGFVDTRLSRMGSFRGSLYDDEDDRQSEMSRASFSQSRRRLSGVDRDKQGMQDSLAAILSGRKPSTATRRDSIDSTFSAVSVTRERKKKKDVNGVSSRAAPPSPVAEPTISNAFAASLAAIRRNRADTMDETSGGSIESPVKREKGKTRDRKRETQLSAEGKELLKKAMTVGDSPLSKSKTKSNGRKGLFDDSSSESDDSDSGLFASGKGRGSSAPKQSVQANGKPYRHSSTTPPSSYSPRQASTHKFDDDDGDDSEDSDATDMSRSANENTLFSKNRTSSPNSTASIGSGNVIRQPPRVAVAYISSSVQNEGKKPAGFYTFAFRVGSLEHTFTYSYNEMEMIHVRLSSEYKNDSLPKFPSKHRLRNNTKPENMQKRALEFVEYFQQLVATPLILTNQRFIFEFRIDENFARALAGDIPNGEVNNNSNVSSRKAQRTSIPVSPVQQPVSSKPPRSATKPTKQLFAADNSDSDDDSDSDNLVVPPSQVQPRRSEQVAESPREQPRSKKASKPSKRDFAEPEPSRRSRRPSSTASRAPSESPAPKPASTANVAPASTPSITGLPPRPNLFGGGRGDLLAAIRQGAALRKTDESSDAATAPGSSASRPDAPRSAPKPGPPPPASAPAASISEAITNAMASRRIHVEYEEAHSDDEDSDDDWD